MQKIGFLAEVKNFDSPQEAIGINVNWIAECTFVAVTNQDPSGAADGWNFKQQSSCAGRKEGLFVLENLISKYKTE